MRYQKINEGYLLTINNSELPEDKVRRTWVIDALRFYCQKETINNEIRTYVFDSLMERRIIVDSLTRAGCELDVIEETPEVKRNCTITVSGESAVGKSTIIHTIKKVLTGIGIECDFNPKPDFKDLNHFENHMNGALPFTKNSYHVLRDNIASKTKVTLVEQNTITPSIKDVPDTQIVLRYDDLSEASKGIEPKDITFHDFSPQMLSREMICRATKIIYIDENKKKHILKSRY